MQYKKLKITHKIVVISICLISILSLCAFEFNKEDYAVVSNKKIFLEVAETPEKQAKGLMYIKKLPEYYGMIFLFNKAEPRSFWMKNVEIPLDIIFIRKNRIVDIHKNVPIDSQNKGTMYKTARKADCVIEINAGFCDKYNVKPGDVILLSRNIYYKWKKLKILGEKK